MSRRELPLRRLLRIGSIIAATFGIAVATTTSANAHVVYEESYDWENSAGTNCLYNYSEVSNGTDDQGYFKTSVIARWNPELMPFDCNWPWERAPGELANGMAIYKWSDGEWRLCDSAGLFYNTQSVYRLDVIYDVASVPGTFCGPGSYGVASFSFLWWDNAWQGNERGLWSGYHDNIGRWEVRSAETPPTPEWVNPDGTIDPDKMPERITVVGKDGKPAIKSNGERVTAKTSLGTPKLPPGNHPGGDDLTRRIESAGDGESIEVVEIQPK